MLPRRVASYIAIILVAAVLVAGAMHFFIPTLHPDQEAPERHVAGPCWSCHVVLSSAKLIELEE